MTALLIAYIASAWWNATHIARVRRRDGVPLSWWYLLLVLVPPVNVGTTLFWMLTNRKDGA